MYRISLKKKYVQIFSTKSITQISCKKSSLYLFSIFRSSESRLHPRGGPVATPPQRHGGGGAVAAAAAAGAASPRPPAPAPGQIIPLI